MIKFEHTEVTGWKKAIFKMRETDGSLEESDSGPGCSVDFTERKCSDCDRHEFCKQSILLHSRYVIGPNDLDMMRELSSKSKGNTNFMDSIFVTVEITAPLYWWNEFDTYKVSTVANSCSTMHKIADKEFTLEDFSTEHLYSDELDFFKELIGRLNGARELYLESKKKEDWWQMIQLLPSSYNQKRTVMMNYEVLANIYKSRKNHKLDEWREHKEMLYITDREDSKRESFKGQYGFCDWIKTLPYSELIIGGNAYEIC